MANRCKLVVLATPKGGTGKTTFAQNLLSLAARDTYRAIGVDLDPQQTLLKWAQRRESTREREPKRAIPSFSIMEAEINRWPMVMDMIADHEIAIVDLLPSIDHCISAVRAICEQADLVLVTTQATMSDLDSTLPWLDELERAGVKVAACLNRVTGAGGEFVKIAQGEIVKASQLCPVVVRNLSQNHLPSMEGMTASDSGRRNNDFLPVWEYVKRRVDLKQRALSA